MNSKLPFNKNFIFILIAISILFTSNQFVLARTNCSKNFLPWKPAIGVIKSGGVQSIIQFHSRKLLITLKDKEQTVLKTYEPQIDDIFRVVEECGETCQDIAVATE